MDHCAAVLLAFPPDSLAEGDNKAYDKAAKAHILQLNALLKDSTAAFNEHAPTLLDHVDPSLNTISYVALLQAVLDGEQTPEGLPDRIVTFLSTFDPRQIRYAGHAFSSVLEYVTSGRVLPPSVSIAAAVVALARIDQTGTTCTSHHLNTARLAYRQDESTAVLPLIDQPTTFYPGGGGGLEHEFLCDPAAFPSSYITPDTGLTSKMRASGVLEYDLLRGLIYSRRRDWAQAHSAYERMVTYPSREGAVSNLMSEGFNKWVLTGLLLSGKAPGMPSSVGQVAQKSLRALGKPYTALATAFETLSAAALRQEAEAQAETWEAEHNTGLVREVLAAYQRWRVLRLADVYSKISIADIRKSTESAETGAPLGSDAEVEQLLAEMIQSGMLKGTIERKAAQPYLAFSSTAAEEGLSEEAFAAEMTRTAQRVATLRPVLQNTNERLSTHREYVKWLVKEIKREKDSGKDPAIGFDSQIEDEDLMHDVLGG